MRKAILFSTLVAIATCALTADAKGIKPFELTPGKWASKSKAEPREWRFTRPDSEKTLRKISSGNEPTQFESENGFSYIDMPDGSTWFVELNYDKEVIAEFDTGFKDYNYTGVKGTVYDSKMQKYAEISAPITMPEGMERCSAIDLGSLVTQKFFNTDNNYEIMFTGFFKPKDAYGAIPMTYVVSLKPGDTPSEIISTIPGYYMCAVNLAADNWSEDYFIEFYSSENDYDVTFDIFSKATTATQAPVSIGSYTVDIRYCPEVTGQESMPVLITGKDRDLYISVARYTKPYFADIDYSNPNPDDDFVTPDNSYQIELYKKGAYESEPVLQSTTVVPLPPVREGFVGNAIGLGMFSANQDISFGFSEDGSVSFILGMTDFDNNFQCETSFAIIDTDGKVIRTFGENNQGYLLLSSISGEPEQYVFVDEDPDVVGGLVYNFYDFPSFEHKVSIPCTLLAEELDGGAALLSMNMDRTPVGKGYNYVFSAANGFGDGTNTLHEIIWMNAEGDLVRVDAINGGKRVNMIKPYINGNALSPYVFNTDGNREYLFYVQRRAEDGLSRAHTELCVGNSNGEMLYQKVFDENSSGIYAALVNVNSNPAIWSEYLDNAIDKNVSTFVPLPLNTLQGAGTAADPYLIACPGDFALIKNNPSGHYRLVDDLDFEGYDITPLADQFMGEFDGAGHTIRNFTLRNSAIFHSLYSTNPSAPCTVHDLTLSNIVAENIPAIIANNFTTNASVSGVHVVNANVTGTSGKGYGTIIARTGVNTMVSGCSVDINYYCPSAEYWGGIIGELGRGSNITACSVNGAVKAGRNVGGIVGVVNFEGSVVADCHVNLDIEGANTIGGIAGDADRSLITRNIVEGTIKAHTPGRKYSQKEGGFVPTMNVGGVIGELATAYGSYNDSGVFVPAGTDPIITNNVVALKSITIPEDDETLIATTHRVVGRSNVNDDPKLESETYDPATGDYILTWGEPAPAEACLANNYVLDHLPVIHSAVGEGHAFTEGANISADKLDREFFEGLGYKFEGYSTEEPWHYGYNTLPELYFEQTAGVSLSFNPASITLAPEEKAIVTLSFEKVDFGSIIFNDNNGDFIFVPLESQAENSCPIEIQVLKEGSYTLEASFGQAKAVLTITGRSAITDVIADSISILTYDGYNVMAEGCNITIYSVAGAAVASGNGTVSVGHLAAGIYVVSATDSFGNTSTLKIAVR